MAKLSPEIVSFLMTLRAVRRPPGGTEVSCFGQYDKTCKNALEIHLDPWCTICQKMHLEDGTEWICALLKAYPGG